MPFGTKTDAAGRVTDFDRVYNEIIKPAIDAAELEPIRADEERVGGTIHKPMYERLILCDFAVADVTGANPNVYYELGIRHAVRPRTTVIMFGEGTLLPFDISLLRGVPYRIDPSGAPANAIADASVIAARLIEARSADADDSPLFQLIEGMPRAEIDHAKTDVFRERGRHAADHKARISEAKKADGRKDLGARQAAVRAIVEEPALERLQNVEAAVIIDLFLALRDVQSYEEMVAFYDRMPLPLQKTRLMQEQLGFALGRLKRFDAAAAVLLDLIASQGPTGETNGILGRIYKDQWKAARDAGRMFDANGFLKKAIDAYAAGYECDLRNPYPGINAVTLMEMQRKPDPRQKELLPVVRYASLQRSRAGGTYWDHATVLEAALLANDAEEALEAAEAACAAALQPWELQTTIDNLEEIRNVRDARGDNVSAIVEIIGALATKKGDLGGRH
jgi:hypothetical protein